MRTILSLLLLTGGVAFTTRFAQGQHNHSGAATTTNLDHSQHGAGSGNGCKLAASDIRAMDARIDQMLTGMDSANGDAKTNAMAALLEELVAQRKQMRDCMAIPGTKVANGTSHNQSAHSGHMMGGMEHSARGRCN